MNNYIFDVNEIVYAPELNKYGKIFDVNVDENNNTSYKVVFDNGSWNSFLGLQLKGDGIYVL